MKKPVFLFVGGESGGHLAPLVAVARELTRLHPDATIHFVCSTKPEDRLFLEAEGMKPVATLEPVRKSITAIPALLSAKNEARNILEKTEPDVVFSKGGAISIPIALAARVKKIPIVLHESDSVSGRANKIVSRFAKVVCEGFPTKNKSAGTHVFTGNPIRPQILEGSREKGLHITGLSGKKPVLLVMGGSQGAAWLNDIIVRFRENMLEDFDIVHLTGRGKETRPPYPDGYWTKAFVTDELPHLYAIASVAVSRSGAGSISELGAWGIPTILVPLEGLAQDHQLKNAEALSTRGACILMRQNVLPDVLLPTLKDLANDSAKRKTLGDTLKGVSQPNAATQLAEILYKVFSEPTRNN